MPTHPYESKPWLNAYAEGVPATAEQYATDVAAFLMWVAEPHMVKRKEDGFRVMAFLILFAGLMWFVKDRLWRPIHHHNPSAKEAASPDTASGSPPMPPRRNAH